MNFNILLLQLLLFLSVPGVFGGFLSFIGLGGEEESEADPEDTKCTGSCYRSFNGSGNNLEHPDWGSAESLFTRLFSTYSYEDGKCKMACLENVRKIASYFCDVPVKDPVWTLATPQFGQLFAHDTALSSSVPQTGAQAITCPCVKGKLTDKRGDSERCEPIKIPKCDPFFAPEGVECFDFIRTRSTCDENPNKPGEQFNAVTSFMDLSPVYGLSEKAAKKLRKFKKGLLKYKIIDGRMYPPQSKDKRTCNDAGAKRPLCIVTGDFRANQNPHIAIMQITLLREHNSIALGLHEINPQWNDEILYQETRRIVIAKYQHIAQNEFFPILIGKKAMREITENNPKGYVKGYSSKVNPSTLNEFAIAFRNFHSVLEGNFDLLDEKRKSHGVVELQNTFNNVSLLLDCETEKYLTIGAATQNEMLMDRYHVFAVLLGLFKDKKANVGEDLITIDFSRGRDHGTATYADAREQSGFKRPKSWEDLEEDISPENVKILKKIYKCVEDVEFLVAGKLEEMVEPELLAGPLFNRIFTEQFKLYKFGDRFWYEFPGSCAFTKDQLKEIRTTTIARLLCKHGGNFPIQREAFEVLSSHNKLVPCSELPDIDLTYWKEN